MTKVTIASLQAELSQALSLRDRDVQSLGEQLTYAKEAAESAKREAASMRTQLTDYRDEARSARTWEMEAARLRGMIEGFERAGKIEPIERINGFDSPPHRIIG
jgi:hypothetical protein